MSNYNGEQPAGNSLQRGDEELILLKVPDQFTARLQRGASPQEVADNFAIVHQSSLTRQDLEVFTVDPSELDAVMDRVRQQEDVAFASHVYALESDPQSRVYLTDEITVQFKDSVSDVEIEELAAIYGLEFVKEVPEVPRTYVFRVTAQATENPIKIANYLLETGKVDISEANITIESESLYMPEDPLFAEQWHLYHSGGPFLEPGSHMDCPRAWDVTRGKRSVVVAVADDSCDLKHEDFKGDDKIVAPRDFTGRDFEPLPEAEDDNHGTACAGVAVAEENEIGVVGVAPGCALMPIRTTGRVDDNSIEDLFDWVIGHGASVVSCSWSAKPINFPLSLRQRNALHRAATQGRNGLGCVIVFAAGNKNRPIDGIVDETGWPQGEYDGPTRWFGGFAAHEDVIAVSACTSKAKKAAYSNWGKEISVCAPSNNVRPKTYPRPTSLVTGRGIVTTDRVGPTGYDSSDYTRRFGGTSSATPAVAGVAALVLSANPFLTAREVKEILEATADKIVDDDADPQLGLRKGHYDENGHSEWFGYGKVNAHRAVAEARSRRADTRRERRETNPDAVPGWLKRLIDLILGR